MCDKIRGRHTGVSRACQSANERSPKKTLLAPPLSIRRVVATRLSPPRNGGRGGGAAVDADAVFAAAEVATAEASVAVAVVDGRKMRWRCPRGRDSAPLPTEGALDGATAPTTERRPPFRWCRHHPPRRRRRETMRRPLPSSSCRRSPTADEGKALGLDRNDDKRTTDDSGRKASDATADDNNSSAISAARMS